MIKTFKKVRRGYDLRYIDNNDKWFRLRINGKFTPSKSFIVEKDYGYIKLDIQDEGVFGLRAINIIL